ncbi:MAG: transketolase C-terminal domain-containing protein [Chloroflexota bacterium]
MRRLSYVQALNEGLHQALEQDRRVFIIGQGVKNPWYVGDSMRGIGERFGWERVIDPPVSEQGINGVAIGAALAGFHPIVVHPRMDFMLMGVEQIINQAANWSYMLGGQTGVPLTIWAIINRGGQQAAQHSQALQAMFAHIPGLKVVMPSTPYDVKGLLFSSILDPNPVMFIDDRWLYALEGDVPEEPYTVPIGSAARIREGSDLTVVATSYMTHVCAQATTSLEARGIDVELIDVRTIKPLDEESILESVRKTGRLVVVDAAWRTCGVAAEIAATVGEKAFEYLKAPIRRVTLPDVPAPMSGVLEKAYYITAEDIVATVEATLGMVKSV